MKMRDSFQDPSYNNSIWQTSGSKKKSKTNIKNKRLCKKIYIILQKHIQTMAKIGKKAQRYTLLLSLYASRNLIFFFIMQQ